jgi:hypothetical protein
MFTGQGPEFLTGIGFLGRQYEKKSEERWTVIMALLEKTLLDENFKHSTVQNVCMLMCGWH